jgi:hypothetical protein
MNKFEMLIEHIINENDQAARELFHQIVVEKSRDIYESLMDDEQMDENLGGNPAENFVDNISNDVEHDEQGLGEEDEDDGDDMGDGDEDIGGGADDEDFDSDMDTDDDVDGDFNGDGDGDGDEEVEDRIMDLETELDQLNAEFEKLVGGDEDGMGDDEGGDDFGDEGGDDFGGDQEDFGGDDAAPGDDASDFQDMSVAEARSGSGKSGSGKSGSGRSGSGKSGSGKSGSGRSGSGVKEAKKTGKRGSGKSGSGRAPRSESEIMKEYVDKIKDFYKSDASEGDPVGAEGEHISVNTKSVSLNKGPDFGGDAKNLNRGGANKDPDGNKPNTGEDNYGKKGRGELPGAGQFKNVPGGDAGKSSFKQKASRSFGSKDSESGKQVGDDGSTSINKKSEIGGKVR